MDDDGSYEELHGTHMLPQHGEGKRVFAQDDLRRLAERDTDTERALAAAEARRDALQRALGQGSTASLRQQLDEAVEEVEELQELLGVRAKRFAAGRPVTMTQGYAAYLRVHGIPRQRHASFSPQVTTPQSGSGPDDGLHEELYGGRMLPENKQALDRLYDAKQTQAEFTGRALSRKARRRMVTLASWGVLGLRS